AGGSTLAAFERFGYTALRDEYDVRFVDLNEDETVEAFAYDADCRPSKVRLARTVADSYRVSVARMKTHNRSIATLVIKNLAVGSVINPDRSWSKLSHTYRAMNLSLARMTLERPPDLSVIDGVVGMEGNGPVSGTAVNSGVALAGVDPTAVDAVGAQVMGYDPRTLGYLYYLMELQGFSADDIRVVGERVEECVTKYRDHPDYKAQLEWRVENWRELLGEVVAVGTNARGSVHPAS
ncbi:MAG: DUF362 domain-containing protein, partial [Gemmatimonadetes bacterium]|nr:DUF362 domain-containing protein [Gemmatimonadota bacterium]